MIYRNMKKEDKPQIISITHEGAPYITEYKDYIYWLASTIFQKYSFVAEENEKIYGFVTVLPEPGENVLFVWQLGVAKAMRGKHIGYHLLQNVWNCAEKGGYKGLITSIEPGNVASYNTFKKIADENHLIIQKAGMYKPQNGLAEQVYKFNRAGGRIE